MTSWPILKGRDSCCDRHAHGSFAKESGEKRTEARRTRRRRRDRSEAWADSCASAYTFVWVGG